MKQRRLHMINNQVDIGVRVETTNIVMQEINENLYEGKFIFNTSVGTRVRTFCSNPQDMWWLKTIQGSCLQTDMPIRIQNLAVRIQTLLYSFRIHFLNRSINQMNMHMKSHDWQMHFEWRIDRTKIWDILKGRRSTEKRIKEGFIEPTLKEAVPGDLGLSTTIKHLKSLIEMTEALNHVTPGIASEHTLFYGVEAKFYSARPKLNDRFETEINGLYVGGDGAGLPAALPKQVHVVSGSPEILLKNQKQFAKRK